MLVSYLLEERREKSRRSPSPPKRCRVPIAFPHLLLALSLRDANRRPLHAMYPSGVRRKTFSELTRRREESRRIAVFPRFSLFAPSRRINRAGARSVRDKSRASRAAFSRRKRQSRARIKRRKRDAHPPARSASRLRVFLSRIPYVVSPGSRSLSATRLIVGEVASFIRSKKEKCKFNIF